MFNSAYLKEHKDDKLLDHRKIDPVVIFQEIDREYFQNALEEKKTKIQWAKNLKSNAFKVEIEKNYITLSPDLLELRSLADFMQSMLHAMTHLHLKTTWEHGEQFETFQARFKDDGWNISDETHGKMFPEIETLKTHRWRCKKCQREFGRFVSVKNFLQRHTGMHLHRSQIEHNKELDDHMKDCGTEAFIEKTSEPAPPATPTKQTQKTQQARNNDVVMQNNESLLFLEHFSPDKKTQKKRVDRTCPFCASHFTYMCQVEFQMHIRNCEIICAKRGRKRPSTSPPKTPKKISKIDSDSSDEEAPKSKEKQTLIEIDDDPIEINSDSDVEIVDFDLNKPIGRTNFGSGVSELLEDDIEIVTTPTTPRAEKPKSPVATTPPIAKASAPTETPKEPPKSTPKPVTTKPPQTVAGPKTPPTPTTPPKISPKASTTEPLKVPIAPSKNMPKKVIPKHRRFIPPLIKKPVQEQPVQKISEPTVQSETTEAEPDKDIQEIANSEENPKVICSAEDFSQNSQSRQHRFVDDEDGLTTASQTGLSDDEL